MNGDFPPSSSDSFLPLPAVASRIFRPDLRRAGERDLVHVFVLDQQGAGAAVAGDDVHHAGRQADLVAQLREPERGQRRVLRRLEHDRVPQRDRRGDLPRQHQQREVPRDDLPDHADRHLARELGARQLRPAAVVVEVPRDERDVDVARLADRLPVVQRLEHGEEAGVLLDAAGDRVQVAGPLVARPAPTSRGRRRAPRPPPRRRPLGVSPARSARSRRRWRGSPPRSARRSPARPMRRRRTARTAVRAPRAISVTRLGLSGRRTVLQGLEDLGDVGHQVSPTRAGGGTRRSSGPVTWCSSCRSRSPSSELAPNRNRAGRVQGRPSSSFIIDSHGSDRLRAPDPAGRLEADRGSPCARGTRGSCAPSRARPAGWR